MSAEIQVGRASWACRLLSPQVPEVAEQSCRGPPLPQLFATLPHVPSGPEGACGLPSLDGGRPGPGPLVTRCCSFSDSVQWWGAEELHARPSARQPPHLSEHGGVTQPQRPATGPLHCLDQAHTAGAPRSCGRARVSGNGEMWLCFSRKGSPSRPPLKVWVLFPQGHPVPLPCSSTDGLGRGHEDRPGWQRPLWDRCSGRALPDFSGAHSPSYGDAIV